jgi:IS1 family transposase
MNSGHLSIKKTFCNDELEKEYGTTWIWTALDPNSRLIICHHVGDRTLESCRKYFHALLSRIDTKPLFTSDELVHYKTVLHESYSTKHPVEQTGKRGPPRKPGIVLDPELDYAVVHKTREKGKVTKVEQRIVFGDEERIKSRLALSISRVINTSYIERSNGRLRQRNSHLRRKSMTFAKEMPYFKAKINITVFVYNFIKPHNSLSKNQDKTTTPRTPALRAGIIEKNWTIDYAFNRPILRQ